MNDRTYTEDEIEAAVYRHCAGSQAKKIMAELNIPKVTFRDGEVVIRDAPDGSPRRPIYFEDDGWDPDETSLRHLNHSELPQYVHDLADCMRVLASKMVVNEDEILYRIEIAKKALAAYRKAGGAE